MRKIHLKYENPIDDILLNVCEILCPHYKNLNFTPNGITTLSLIFGILSVMALFYKNMGQFLIFYYLSYFYDCLDGHYARKYNMVTKFGDLYDHFKDNSISLLIGYILFFTHKVKLNTFVFILLGGLLVGTGIHLGLQQSLYNHTCKNKDKEHIAESLDNLSKINHFFGIGKTKKDVKKYIQYSKYLGCGTVQFIIPIVILYLL
jgi:hypothetical protein